MAKIATKKATKPKVKRAAGPKKAGGDAGQAFRWYIPGSVLNALWGSVMPRLAATVWRNKLEWPPRGTQGQLVEGSMYAFPLAGEAIKAFWSALAENGFGSEKNYTNVRDKLDGSGTLENGIRVSAGQRAAHVCLEYFDPAGHLDKRMPVRIIRAEAYDFVLSSDGLDIFIPDDPFKDGNGEPDLAGGRTQVVNLYRFRETGRRPIALPGVPMTFKAANSHVLIPIPQLTTPTGSYQIHEGWTRGKANDVKWWIAGSTYRGIMASLPRIIACKWYDELVGKNYGPDASVRPTVDRFGSELRKLLEERIETKLPALMQIQVASGREKHPAGWHAWDVMITDQGFRFPDPGTAPTPDEILEAIEKGRAGNPVFTDSDTDE